MIKNITAGSGLTVQNNYSNWPSFYNNSASANNTLVGQVRYSGSSQCMEVYDGTTWLTMTSASPTVDLAPHVQAIVEWAQKKMAEEEYRKEMAMKYPAVADALEALKRAEEQVQIVAALVQE